MMLDREAIENLLEAKRRSGKPFCEAEAYLHLCFKLDGCVSKGVYDTTTRQLAEVWGWYQRKAQRFLKKLEKDELIELVNCVSHTIVHWGKRDPHRAPGMSQTRSKTKWPRPLTTKEN